MIVITPIVGVALAAAVSTAPIRVVNAGSPVVADSMPQLTVDVLTKMTTFWKSFFKEPDSIKTAAQSYKEPIMVYVGDAQTQIPAINVLRMATHYPSIAADLKQAGLSGEEFQTYRATILSAALTKAKTGASSGAASSNETVAKNTEFLKTHEKEFAVYEALGVIPKISTGGGQGDDLDP